MCILYLYIYTYIHVCMFYISNIERVLYIRYNNYYCILAYLLFFCNSHGIFNALSDKRLLLFANPK